MRGCPKRKHIARSYFFSCNSDIEPNSEIYNWKKIQEIVHENVLRETKMCLLCTPSAQQAECDDLVELATPESEPEQDTAFPSYSHEVLAVQFKEP